MTITTKFNVGDTIWFLHDSKVQSRPVRQVECRTSSPDASADSSVKNVVILYTISLYAIGHGIEGGVKTYDQTLTLREELCFATKERLLDSL